MSEPRRHHLVPRFYLRRFADDREQLRVVARDDLRRSFLRSIDDASVERDFYAIETTDGWSQELEKRISNVEAVASGALARVLEGWFPPSPEDREVLAAFIALQFIRGSDLRRAYQGVLEHMAKMMAMNMTRAQARKVIEKQEGRAATEAEVDELIEFASDPDAYKVEVDVHQNDHIKNLFGMWPGLTRLAFARKWQLLRVYGARLLTSDAPVSLWTAPQNMGPFGGTGGFAVCDEIVLPLDRRHALLLLNTSPVEDEVMTPVTRGMASELNMRTAFSGSRWLFHHPGDSPLQGVVLPPSTPKISAADPPFRLVPDDV